jgi:2-oxoglutarate ferredoxin oxidoreductase subunit beta
MLTYGATYVAQAFAGNPKMCAELIKGAMEHKGFAYVNIFSQCPSFNKLDTAKWYRGLVEDLPEDHDPTNMDQAIAVARRPNGKAPVGLIYKEDRYTLCDEMKRLVKQVGGSPDYDKQKIVDAHIP